MVALTAGFLLGLFNVRERQERAPMIFLTGVIAIVVGAWLIGALQ